MAIVWQNSFDGVPGTNLTVANSADWGTPLISTTRNGQPASAVRYGDRAYMGASSMQLGAADGSTYGDTWVYAPTVNAYSLSFYLYLAEGGWFRFRDGNNVSELYLATASQSVVVNQNFNQDAELFDRWVRIEYIVSPSQLGIRIWWTDADSTGTPDYEYLTARAGGTVGDLLCQGGATQNVYVDQIQIGEGEWVGPWPEQHTTVALEGSMGMSGQLTAESVEDDHTRLRGETRLTAPPVAASKHARVGLSAAIDLGAVTPVVAKASSVTLTGEIGQLQGQDATSSKASTVALEGVVVLDGDAETRGIFRPTFPPTVVTEILIDDAWEDISGDVYVRDPIHIERGRADEAAEADPASLSLTLNNRDGKYSPRNPLSPYYGKLGRNTQIQIRVGDLPEEEAPEVADTFNRTVAPGGWGTADSGQVWTELGSVTAPFSVSGGRGRMAIGQNDFNYIIGVRDERIHPDFDVTYTVQVSEPVQGNLNSGVFASCLARTAADGQAGYSLEISFRSAEGASAGAGRVMASIRNWADNYSVCPLIDVPTVTYEAGVPLNVRAQGLGPNLRLRVWEQGQEEPELWHAQGWDDTHTEGGLVGFQSRATTDVALQEDFEVSFGDFEAARLYDDPDVVRFTGQVAAWPIRWDVSDTDVWVNLEAAGPKRRLGQGSETIRSAMYNAITASHPVAYWPMEDGSQTRIASAASPNTPDMRIVGMHFSDNDDLPTSLALPTYGRNGRMSVSGLPTTQTGVWELDAAIYLAVPDEIEIPSGTSIEDAHAQMTEVLNFETTTHRYSVSTYYADTSGGDDPSFYMGVIVYDTASGELVGHPTSSQWINLDDMPFDGRESWMSFFVRAIQEGGTDFVQYAVWTPLGVFVSGFFSFPYTVGRIDTIQTSAGAGAEGSSIGHIAIWDGTNPTGARNGFAGYEGESAHTRLARVSGQNGIPLLLRGQAETRMGIEYPQTSLELLEQAAASDFGVLDERRAGLMLNYRSRSSFYNQDPVIELDYANGEINPPVEPTDDDQALRNDVTVQRQDGAESTARVQDGPLGISTVGPYTESTTLSLATDAQTQDQAGWRLHLGQVDELRWPLIHLNLANRRLGLRIEDILNLDVGDRIRILNPPQWTQAEHLDLIVQGYSETINLFQWDIMLTCTPASPWNVGRMGDDDASQVGPSEPSRADTAGSVLVTGVDAQATEFEVETVRGPNWVSTASNPDSLPFDITLGGEIMEVTDIQSDSQVQTFTVVRSVNGVVKPHGAGDSLSLANPAVTAL